MVYIIFSSDDSSKFLLYDNIILQYILDVIWLRTKRKGFVVGQKYLQIGTRRILSSDLIDQFAGYMRLDRGLAESTITKRITCTKDFFEYLEDAYPLDQLNIADIDKILEKYATRRLHSRRTVQSNAASIRAFFVYAEGRGWCQQGLAQSIKSARIYRHETLPYSPSWEEVQRLLETTQGDEQADIRDRAIIMLLAIYGLRRGEVARLRLNDLDWKKEILYVRRTKNTKFQEFPRHIRSAMLFYVICKR